MSLLFNRDLVELLRIAGFDKQVNESLSDFLLSLGYTKALPDSLYDYLQDKSYDGDLSTKLYLWSLDNWSILSQYFGPNQVATFFVPPVSVPSGIEFVGSVSGHLVNTAAATYSLPLTSWTGGIDTDLLQDDVVILLHGVANGSNLSHGISGSTGWTESTELYANGSSRDMNGRAAWKVMGSTPDSSVTVVAGSNGTFPTIAMAMAFRGVDPVNPMAVDFIMSQAGNNETMDPPALTLPPVDNCMVVTGALATSAKPPTSVTSAPTGFINLAEHSWSPSSGSVAANVAMATKLQTTAQIEDPSAFTGNTAASVGGTVRMVCALRPA